MPERLCLLSVHAHPDDEASKGAPTVARYHAEGVHTVLVCCTGGEEGDILNPAMDTPEVRADIGRIRMAEFKASTDIIGYDETVLLGYRDSGMPDSEANASPDSFAQAPLDEAVGRLVAVIRRERPQVIITYGDNQTEYPHPDHLRVHEISVLAFDSAGDPDRYPEAGPPFTPAKLYYSVWSGERFRQIHEKFLELGLESPFDDKWLARMTRTEPFTTTIDVTGFTQVRGEALKAHATQVDPNSPFWFGLPPEVMRDIHPVDEFRLAQSRVGPDRRDRGRPLRRGARRNVSRAGQAVGPRKPQLMTPALCNSTTVTAAASTPSRMTVDDGFHLLRHGRRARVTAHRRGAGPEAVPAWRQPPARLMPGRPASARGRLQPAAWPCSLAAASVGARRRLAHHGLELGAVQPFTSKGVTAPPPRSVSTTQPVAPAISHCETRSQPCAARPGRAAGSRSRRGRARCRRRRPCAGAAA